MISLKIQSKSPGASFVDSNEKQILLKPHLIFPSSGIIAGAFQIPNGVGAMLKIREEQMKVFEAAALRSFEDEMAAHARKFSPRLCEILGDEQLHAALRHAMRKASADYGFTNRGPMRLYIDLIFLFGSRFDTDPQYPKLGKILNDPDDQMRRADGIYHEILDYMETVAGPDSANVHKALEFLAALKHKPVALTPDSFDADMVREMARAFPQKAAYVGDDGLAKLIRKARTEAKEYGFPTLRGVALLAILKFAFGHGCTDDPLYPWISATLRDEKIVDSEARAMRLENKAMTWLDHVLTRLRKGERL